MVSQAHNQHRMPCASSGLKKAVVLWGQMVPARLCTPGTLYCGIQASSPRLAEGEEVPCLLAVQAHLLQTLLLVNYT